MKKIFWGNKSLKPGKFVTLKKREEEEEKKKKVFLAKTLGK